MPRSAHDDPASTILYDTARRMVEEATPKGRRLLELFARHQVLALERLLGEFETSQNGLNALLGSLTLRFQELQDDPGFYIHIPKLGAWAIGSASQTNLRKAIRAVERARQRELRFADS